MAANSTRICAHTSFLSWSEHHLDHTQQTEKLLIEQYTQVLEALGNQYLSVGKLFMEVEKESFEGTALSNLLRSIREAMRQNEVGLTETRRNLWKRYWEGVGGNVGGSCGAGEESNTRE